MTSKMSRIDDIKSSYLCYGCGACNVLCAHQAITMEYDNIGRLLPMIDEAKCTNCGLCYNRCPSLDLNCIQLPNTEDKYVGNVNGVYIGKATDDFVFKNSQSGGLVTATVKYLFETGRIDAAVMCRVEDAIEYTPKAVVISSVNEVYSCQKSSYVPVDILSALKEVKKYNSIAVVGTGCHIQGVKAIQSFNKQYKEKIKYTLGLICDRTLCKTASDVLYGDHFKDISKRIVWRDKTVNYKNARLLIKTVDNRTIRIPTWKRHTLKDPFTNPRCRICFDKLNTNADIVFGDPWGMSNVDWDRGMSLVITRTSKGADVITGLTNDCQAILTPASLAEVIRGQQLTQRRKDVSSALSFYNRSGWLMPKYASDLIPSEENTRINSLITNFIENSNQSKDRIIKKNRWYLRMVMIKNFFSVFIRRSIRFVKRIKF